MYWDGQEGSPLLPMEGSDGKEALSFSWERLNEKGHPSFLTNIPPSAGKRGTGMAVVGMTNIANGRLFCF